jgi:hypothetical protein
MDQKLEHDLDTTGRRILLLPHPTSKRCGPQGQEEEPPIRRPHSCTSPLLPGPLGPCPNFTPQGLSQ